MKRRRIPMSRASRINLVAAIVAVCAAVCAASIGQEKSAPGTRGQGGMSLDIELVDLADGGRALVDASGTQVRLQSFQRIVSASTASDWLVVELCEPERVVAVTERSVEHAPWRHRFAGKSGVASLSQLESLLAMRPDLLLLDSFGDPRRVARLREQGLAVFDLGQMRGLDTLVATIVRVGHLCGHPDRGQRLARRVRQSVLSLAQDIPESERPSALYLSPYGDKLFGGTTGTGYHDMLVHAGLRDAAAARFSDFPEYNAEQVLALDPDLVVTRAGMASALCRHAGLDALRACSTPGSVIELEDFSIDDPGLGLVESIESLYQAVHGQAVHDQSAHGQPAHGARDGQSGSKR